MELISYLSYCLKNNKIIKWPDNCMPIKFYIAPFRWYKAKDEGYYYKQMVVDAINIWQKASNNKISFQIVSTLNESQINLDWKRVDRSSLGQCYFNYDNQGRLYSAEINIGLSDGVIHTQYQDKNEVFHTILHEIGHAIGLDHSPYKNDIMYVPHQYGIVNISNRDKLTLKWLYKFPYGITDLELLNQYKFSSDHNIDHLIYKLENNESDLDSRSEKFSIPELANMENELALNEEQNLLAQINKYNLSLQNITISSNLQEYVKKIQAQKTTKSKKIT